MGDIEPTRRAQPAAAISRTQHAMLGYGVAMVFLAAGATLLRRHRPASTFAVVNGATIVAMSMLTDYPGGVLPVLSFRRHGTGDILQAILAGAVPLLFGFARDPEARYFYGQPLCEAGVIAVTDWNARPKPA